METFIARKYTFCVLAVFFLLACLPIRAQVNLRLPSEKYAFRNEGFFVEKVEDMRPSRYFLGKVFLRNGEHTDLLLQGGTEEAFLQDLNKNLNQDKNGTALTIKIKALNFSEQKNSKGLVDGQAKMEVAFFGELDGKEILVCTARSGSQYNRSLGTAHATAYEPILHKMWETCLNYGRQYIAQNANLLEVFNTGSVVYIAPLSQVNSGDTVHYASRKVRWTDFQASPRYTSKFAAAIFPSIGLNTSFTVKDKKIVANIQPLVYMIPSQSWAKPGSKNPEALDHEQIHFDIAYVVMQRLIGRVKKLEAHNVDDLNSQIQYEYLQAFTEMNRLQKQYDAESNHNLNKGGQAVWKRKVADWLREYDRLIP
ncbi:hypothetical protein LAG90_17410 [Marinilongibacter aquaticus]|uniref:DUF922 domain-containing protein n=1 Tax=Marinilongibacter aquaticus TaxID=2975157 RepID=UPI0021BDEDE4|nr:hypothetical protein [Marinilongibacter aquaticus]UBM58583.1 hypothetical protein LAG90_17410 [Marinilongibacter aquaticus]